jgi:hypothetical protein
VTGLALLVMPFALGFAQSEEPPTPEPATEHTQVSASGVRPLLDAARDDLVGLEFEKALAAIEALLGRPDLNEAARAEALVLRSEAHVAFGDLGAAEQDYRQILRLRPDFVPDSSLTPRKGMERFRKARAALIGDLVLELAPSDTRITIDGRSIEIPTGGKLALVAGEHVVVARRPGFDSLRQTVQVEANQDGRLELRLVPNARSVVLVTEPEGVDVTLDGSWVGRTSRDPDTDRWTAQGPARLTLESLPLGEHLFELTLDCHRRERIRDLLTVDLLDWSPKLFPLVTMVEVSSTIVLRDGPEGASVLVDGQRVTRLPADPIAVCPGRRTLELRHADRTIWRSTATLAEAEEVVLRVEPRPNVVLVGPAEWPDGLHALEQQYNTEVDVSLAVPAEPSAAEGWARLALDRDVDLVIAPRSRPDGGPAWWLYSPHLQAVAPFDPGALPGRPLWTSVSWGLFVVDSERYGPAVVAQVTPGGAAERAGVRAGDRLTSLGGTQVVGAAQARRILGVASSSAPLDAEWLSPDGAARRGRLAGEPTLRLIAGRPGIVASAVRAAWAVVDAATGEEVAPAARANLALLLSTFGRHELAVQSWRRVELPDNAGIGRGTVQYYLGRDLERSGAEREAIEALRVAAGSDCTAFDDEGPRIAPAARDRLVDLGVK